MLKHRYIDKETATQVSLSSLACNYKNSKPEKIGWLYLSEIRKQLNIWKNTVSLFLLITLIITVLLDKGNGHLFMNKSDY